MQIPLALDTVTDTDLIPCWTMVNADYLDNTVYLNTNTTIFATPVLNHAANDIEVTLRYAGTSKGTGFYYGIASDGTIVQMVSEANTPWTNGGSDSVPLPNPVGSGTVGYNTNSVTIEISNLRVINKTGPNTFVATDGKEYNFKVDKKNRESKSQCY